MKKYKVDVMLNGKSHALTVEGARNIIDAAKTAEAFFKAYTADAEIRSVIEIYN